MIDVATLSVIRRWALREQLSIREIARRTGLSRNTIRKYLRAGEAEPHYAKRVSPSKLDPFALKLSAGSRRKLADPVSSGVPSSRYTPICRRWAIPAPTTGSRPLSASGKNNAWWPSRPPAAAPLCLWPSARRGVPIRWSEDWAVLAGVRTKLQVAHFKLSHSRAFYLRAYLLQTHEMLFDAHNHAFVVLGGVPRRGIYDNMRTAVDQRCAVARSATSMRALRPW